MDAGLVCELAASRRRYMPTIRTVERGIRQPRLTEIDSTIMTGERIVAGTCTPPGPSYFHRQNGGSKGLEGSSDQASRMAAICARSSGTRRCTTSQTNSKSTPK